MRVVNTNKDVTAAFDVIDILKVFEKEDRDRILSSVAVFYGGYYEAGYVKTSDSEPQCLDVSKQRKKRKKS